MKVIELLNKIANREEVPKKIRIRGIYYRDYNDDGEGIDIEDMTIWKLDTSYKNNKDYYSKEGKNLFETYLINRILNDEVEILD